MNDLTTAVLPTVDTENTLHEAPEHGFKAVTVAAQCPASELVAAWLGGRNGNTVAAYRADLEAFQVFSGSPDLTAAAAGLIGSDAGTANHAVLRYRNALSEQGLSPATVNRRLAALRSLVKLGRTLGFCNFSLEVGNLKAKAYKDVRGPAKSAIHAALDLLDGRQTHKAARDNAILALFIDLGLRVSEVVGLDMEHMDLAGHRISILGKGRLEREWLTVPDTVVSALERWIAVRGTALGALFVNFSRSDSGGQRITRRGIGYLVAKLGTEVGSKVHPHAFRHFAITQAVGAAAEAGIDIRQCLKFSRHASLDTLAVYVDAAADAQGRLADLVSARVRSR